MGLKRNAREGTEGDTGTKSIKDGNKMEWDVYHTSLITFFNADLNLF
jgi:hypothetical protein